MISDSAFWALTLALGIGTFLIRFSFLGLLGGRQLPDWALLHLKYVGVAVFPALVAPLVLWPEATGGTPDAPRIIAAIAAFVAGMRVNVVAAIITGMSVLYALQFILQ
ncbi:MAG: AzlD domain-containing protein [Paracoccaceae bacterium]